MEKPNYFSALFSPIQSKPKGRQVWGIDLETFWIPTLTASNVRGETVIPNEALGCPLRLATGKDGSVKFGNNGKPVFRVAKEISDSVKTFKQNIIALGMNYIETTKREKPEEYKKAVALQAKAGEPIAKRDAEMVLTAMQARREAEEAILKAQAEAEEQVSPKSTSKKEFATAGAAS